MRNGFWASFVVLFSIAGFVIPDEPRLPDTESVPIGLDLEAPPQLTNDAALSGAPGYGLGPGSGRSWASAEFLLWWIRDGNVPPLVTTGPLASEGVLGAPGTTVLFGGDLDYGTRPGARFTIGTWLGCDQKIGIEASYFFLGGSSPGFDARSGSALLARPFFNVVTGEQSSQLVAFPGVVAGSIGISSDSLLHGGELNLLCNRCCWRDCCCNSGFRLDLLAGVRYLQLNEDLVIAENLTFLEGAPEPFEPGSTIAVVDSFETRNSFYGGQLGARAEWWRGRWYFNLTGKVALGNTHQLVRVNGSTVFTDAEGVSVRRTGGLLALPTNIGSRSRDVFSVVPEVGFNVGYQLTHCVRVFAGYSFLYWSNVVRPGDQIDFGINPTQIPSAAGPGTLAGQARPASLFSSSDFWAQGINLGVEFRW